MSILNPVLETIDGFLAWFGSSLGQLNETYCMLETATDKHTFAARDGSLISVIRIYGATFLVGPEEFERIHQGLTQSLQSPLSRAGHCAQLFFQLDKEDIEGTLNEILDPARKTAKRLDLDLTDLFDERVKFLSNYCSNETTYLVLWTTPGNMTKSQADQAKKNAIERAKESKAPPIRNAQNVLAGIPELTDTHNSYVKGTLDDMNDSGLYSVLIDVHTACRAIRNTTDADFTDKEWQASLPGDPIPARETTNFKNDLSDILWPPLPQQLIPRDGENIDLRTARIGDRIYSSVFIDLFPKDTSPFLKLFRRLSHVQAPWRISYFLQSQGMADLGLKPVLASFLSFASNQNKLINGAMNYLNYIQDNTDEAIVKLKFTITTWTHYKEENLLRTQLAEIAKAVQGWGYTETSEICGDAYAGVLSSALALTTDVAATASIAPLSDVIYMFPLTRPASPWVQGAVLFRSPDGKPWPYQPGSTLQTTWIDIVYARPGSGKSVLSNSINLALCLSGGIQRLPRIAIVDIGPSSSGLISLIKESLPKEKKHLVAYHRLRMVKEMSINPFDTQLGTRIPSPQDRAFLVNFLTLLATPVGQDKSYDGISDMAGMIVDQLYENLSDNGNPHPYTANLEPEIDEFLSSQADFKIDSHTTWWEITDLLFSKDKRHLATKCQRYAMPLLADAASICRSKSIEDLYGKITAPTGESIIEAFGRMISSAVREYPILSRITSFDLGETRIVSLDLDEVAKTGGEAADRQTAVMYMLARYVLARHFYLTEDNVKDMPELYKEYHRKRVLEIREDPKRIVFDEFHRTSKSQAVRDQIIVDMREGRKWKVQVALLSQSIDDFDPVMIEFATAIFVMDAGPKQAVEKSAKIFGLSETAKLALTNRVHGPRAGGATFLAQFATKSGVNTQLITSTIGPIELWAFNTTAEDARIRNALYEQIGAGAARKVLAALYPSGSAAKVVEERLAKLSDGDDSGSDVVSKEQSNNVIDTIISEIADRYHTDKELRKRLGFN